nr:unnamed protein product [Callosobruchus analis]
MAKLDDFLTTKKKEAAPILDLSKSLASNEQEFRKLLEKVPEFKIKPERVLPEHIKIREKHFRFKCSKRDTKVLKEKYAFMDPLPMEMKGLKIDDLAAVSIDWKMLTTMRPQSKIEENYFSRLVELGKLQLKSRAHEKRQAQFGSQIRKSKNKAGIVETRAVSCIECGEEFCNGKSCTIFSYDSFARIPDMPQVAQKASAPSMSNKGKIKIKRKSRPKSRSKKRDRKKSKSPMKRDASKTSRKSGKK